MEEASFVLKFLLYAFGSCFFMLAIMMLGYCIGCTRDWITGTIWKLDTWRRDKYFNQYIKDDLQKLFERCERASVKVPERTKEWLEKE